MKDPARMDSFVFVEHAGNVHEGRLHQCTIKPRQLCPVVYAVEPMMNSVCYVDSLSMPLQTHQKPCMTPDKSASMLESRQIVIAGREMYIYMSLRHSRH